MWRRPDDRRYRRISGNNILYAKYPLGKPKKTDILFRERMPALICHTLPK